jgi:hypothetical protein
MVSWRHRRHLMAVNAIKLMKISGLAGIIGLCGHPRRFLINNAWSSVYVRGRKSSLSRIFREESSYLATHEAAS